MIRNIVVLALACSCLTAAAVIPTFTLDKETTVKQKLIYQLLWHVDQPEVVHPDLHKKAVAYNVIDHIDSFTDKVVVTDFVQRYKYGMLPRRHVFSVVYDHLREEMIALFNLFFYAKDFDTFYNVALWARYHVNEQMYVMALWTAVYHRPDTKNINLPPIYEVVPYYFFNTEVIQHAHFTKMAGHSVSGGKPVEGVYHHVIHANYTGWYTARDYDHEEHMSYFTEDIGLNAYYYNVFQLLPFWLSSEQYNVAKGIRGEWYFFGHQQLLARYYLERLTNGLGEIEDFDWSKPIITGYHPTMTFPNSLPFPIREHYSDIPMHKYKYLQVVEDLETRISNAIDAGYILGPDHKFVDIYTPEGLEILGNIVEGNADSYNPKFYGSIDRVARKILGFNLEPVSHHEIYPSALEIYSTSMRDPMFYRMYKWIVGFYHQYKEHLVPYTHDELVFPGVSIESVVVDKLLTYFEHFDTNVNNVVGVQNYEDAQSYVINARQHRLNHKPFTYHITVKSDKATKASVRIFLGPKWDHHHRVQNISDNYENFFELDHWIVDLKPGMNKIERASHENSMVSPDPMTSALTYKQLTTAAQGGEAYTYVKRFAAFPERLVLPKGKKEGMHYQLFVYVNHINEIKRMEFPGYGVVETDGMPLGFPLDKPMFSHNFTVPNMYFKDVVIYHKELEELNLTV